MVANLKFSIMELLPIKRSSFTTAPLAISLPGADGWKKLHIAESAHFPIAALDMEQVIVTLAEAY
jgi:hypothetical protein